MKGRITTTSAIILLGCYASVGQGGLTNASSPVVGSPVPNSSAEFVIAAVDYFDYFDYFDEIIRLENPVLLSDADLLELIIDDGSSAILF